MHLKQLAGSLIAIAAIGTSIFLYGSHPVWGSDHQDSPTVVARPAADITDVFTFPSPTDPKAFDLVMDVLPLIPPGMSANFSFDPGVLYQFKIAHGPVGSVNPEDTILQMIPQGVGAKQKLAFYAADNPSLIGARTIVGTPLGTIPYNRPEGSVLSSGIKAFAGPRADPFFFDLFQFFRILPDRDFSEERSGDQLGSPRPSFNGYPAGATSGTRGAGYGCNTAPATNTLTQINGGFNVLSIVLEVPRASMIRAKSPLIHLWETTSVPTSQTYQGKVVYQQIELLSRPAVKEVFETFNEHSITNVSSPFNDPQIKNSIQYFMGHVAGRSAAIGNVVANVLTPNVMIADISQPGPAAYLGVETGGATGGKFGGRALTDDVITTSLGVIFGNTVPALGLAPDDGKENNCLTNQHLASGQGGRQTQRGYPYLTTPH